MPTLLHTQPTTSYGAVQYERGFEIVEIEGWIEESGPWLLIFGDPDRPARQQRHTAVPIRRVVEMDLRGAGANSSAATFPRPR